MKIIITGSCGHIGSYVVENLSKIKKVKTAILIDNLKSNRFNSIFNLKNKPKIFFFQRDLTNKKSLTIKRLCLYFYLYPYLICR